MADTPAKPPRDKSTRGITAANARAMVEHRRALGKMGGRPKGVLNKTTIAKINSRETFVEHVSKHAGKIADDLLRNSDSGDTRAGLGLLDRIGIAPVQKVEGEIKFSLSALGKAREVIDGNADVISVDAPRDAEHATGDALEVPSQVE